MFIGLVNTSKGHAYFLAVVFYPLCPTDSIHSVEVEFW